MLLQTRLPYSFLPGAFSVRRLGGFKIARPVDVGDQSGPLRLPSQLVARPGARSWAVHDNEMRQPAEVIGGFVGSLADRWHAEASADHAGDFAEGNPLFGDSVVTGSRPAFLEREPVKNGGVQAVDRRPAVRAIAHKGGNALFARHFDERRDEAPVAVVVHRWRKPELRDAHALGSEGPRRLPGPAGKIGSKIVLLAGQGALAAEKQRPGGDHQRAV